MLGGGDDGRSWRPRPGPRRQQAGPSPAERGLRRHGARNVDGRRAGIGFLRLQERVEREGPLRSGHGEGEGHRDEGSATSTEPKLEKATFGAGCFWHVEAEFEWLPGVKSAVSGYAGGQVPNPSYEMVHEGDTGHAEVVQVEYDPSVISYEQLLKVFWHGHDPTQWMRQGPDFGPQYRSVIFYHNEEQRKAALKSYRELVAARAYRAPIVTQLFPMKDFFRAEDYHQNYYGGKDDRPAGRPSRSRRTAKAGAEEGGGRDGQGR